MGTSSSKGISFAYVNASEVIGLGAALPAIGIVIVSTRFYLRGAQRLAIAADDWLSLDALVLPSMWFSFQWHSYQSFVLDDGNKHGRLSNRRYVVRVPLDLGAILMVIHYRSQRRGHGLPHSTVAAIVS